MRINSEVLTNGFLYVDTVMKQHGSTTMTPDQFAGKVLYDMQTMFDEAPELELVSILALASHFAEHPETVDFLRNEFEMIIMDCQDQGVEIHLELQPHEKALFYLFLKKPFESFRDPIAV